MRNSAAPSGATAARPQERNCEVALAIRQGAAAACIQSARRHRGSCSSISRTPIRTAPSTRTQRRCACRTRPLLCRHSSGPLRDCADRESTRQRDAISAWSMRCRRLQDAQSCSISSAPRGTPPRYWSPTKRRSRQIAAPCREQRRQWHRRTLPHSGKSEESVVVAGSAVRDETERLLLLASTPRAWRRRRSSRSTRCSLRSPGTQPGGNDYPVRVGRRSKLDEQRDERQHSYGKPRSSSLEAESLVATASAGI
jgi:hypothetical protein